MRAAWQRLVAVLSAIANWRFFKPAVFLACAYPLAQMSYRFWTLYTERNPDAFGVDPVKEMLHETGETALLMLLLSLCVTPFRRIFGINRIQILRRMVGLWAFTYGVAHLSVYSIFDQNCYSLSTCNVDAIWQDILKRKFIFMGMLAFFCLLLLALTSTNGWIRRLKKNWVRLHRVVYVAAGAAVIHFIWIQKSDIAVPLRWAYWLAALLLFRVFWYIRKGRPAGRKPVTA